MPANSYTLILAAFLLICSGCTAQHPELPALVLQPAKFAGIDDQRASYRREFCRRIAPSWTHPCDDYLRNFADEKADEKPSATQDQNLLPMNVFVVSGLFNECFRGLEPFGDARLPMLRDRIHFFDIDVHGRASSENNAVRVRDAILVLLAQTSERRLNIILSYSKGTVDSLTALTDSRELADHIDALISVAGAVNGSPLADIYAYPYNTLAAKIPIKNCPVTDQGELASLTRSNRMQWLTTHSLPAHPRYFSLVAAPLPERVSLALQPMYTQLARYDSRNDGQLLAWDAVIPGSILLGYLNADHFAVALPLLHWHPVAMSAFANANNFPRQAMVTAALMLVQQTLENTPAVAQK